MYSRASPSPRYRELLGLYADMHRVGEPDRGRPPGEMYSGVSLLPQAARIRRVVEATGAARLLDYGCGKGQQYEKAYVDPEGHEHASVAAYWGVREVARYDPAWPPFTTLPQGTFDGVVCTDVLEHCPEEDLPWIVDEMFGYAEMFVFANVASYAALRKLANGENAHCTVRPTEWWESLFDQAAQIGRAHV